MKRFISSFPIFFSLISAQGTRPNICIPLAQGWEQIDDSPAINEALRTCGNGGTIILPATEIYSIRTPIDFSPCANCDFQIEGTLLAARDQWSYWQNVDSIFSIAGAKGVRIHSVTGTGVVDGNAIDYYLGRWDSGFWTTESFVEIRNESTDVTIENLRMRNVMHRFIRAQGNSTNITLRNLTLTMEQQWGKYPRNEYDAAGIELGETTGVRIEDVDMIFTARPNHGGTIGICVAIDRGAHDIDIRDVDCRGAWGGVLVTLDSIGIRGDLTPAQALSTVSDVYTYNLTFDGDTATGFRSGWYNSNMTNITWDAVTIVNGNPATGALCWLKNHGMTSYWPNCQRQLAATVTDVWFKNFRGKLPTMPAGPGWERVNNLTTTEYHFEGWQNSTI